MEAPPPYPGLKSPQQSENPNPLPDTDLKICTHTHTLLAVRSQSSTTLHYWSPSSDTVKISSESNTHIAIPTNLDPSSMQLIRGFRNLGTFAPPATDDDPTRIALQFFSSLLDNVSCDSELSSEIIARLSTAPQHPSTHNGPVIQVFAIPVLSDTVEGLVGDDTHKPIWKWAKPSSNYDPKTGFWEVEVDRAVEDGERRAGKELQLLVRGVSTEKFEELKDRRVWSLG
ncbi:uncharacterized protein F4822DRAFT_427502 [Hypoxylon trugodes]|uniref:uncharacterized protein n=1 Tax=Hypoxylon trugodes TaxID=326681 RepID=UPI00219E3E6A|nr:uncharacterized protein F4822DRAFT_427502 [Hypoxylon trugodes]KAI1391646.1 hypothetical protein F4822DRAFT_427502 [Hypoxylon trugodes]